MKQKSSIVKIAKEAGVSTATISRVINNPDTVSNQTREKVLAVVAKYGYMPNSQAISKLSGLKSVLLIVPDVKNPFYANLCSIVQRDAYNNGFSLKLVQLNNDALLTNEEIEKLVASRPVGVIISGYASHCINSDTIKIAVEKFNKYIPTIVINNMSDDLNCVSLSCDLAGCTKDAVQHLYSLGHRKIALVGSDEKRYGLNTRENGYLQQITALGLKEYPFTLGKTAQHGEVCIQQLFQSHSGKDFPTAIITYNDLVALGAFKHINIQGLTIPNNIAVVSCDNQFFAPYMCPPLSSSELHMDEIASYAVSLIADARGASINPFKMAKKSTLIVRQSCGSIA